MGNRVAKKVFSDNTFDPGALERITYYLRDASGNVMSIYEESNGQLNLTEQHIYGSSRVGMRTLRTDMLTAPVPVQTGVKEIIRGERRYELTNHLGNVLVVCSDQLTATDGDSNNLIDFYAAEVVSYSDYYPFGSVMGGRSTGTGRYGFNSKELDIEGMGGGSSTYDYGFRIYNAALAKFLSVDPLSKEYPWYTTYQFAGNMPVIAIDLDGLEEMIRTRYYDSGANLYRTEIQIVTYVDGSDHEAYGLGSTQLIHETIVNVDNNGIARAAYFGTTIGNRIAPGSAPNVGAAGGSSSLSLLENNQLFNIVPTGTADALGNPLSDITSVSGGLQKVLTTRIRTMPNGTTQIQLNSRGRPMTWSKDLNNIIVINNSAAPVNEPYLPEGFNLTPEKAADRYLIPMQGGGPIPIETPRSNDLPVTRFLLWLSQKPGTTYDIPPGASNNVPSRAATQAAGGNPKNTTNRSGTVITQ